MKWQTFEIQRTPGFRFNLIDVGLITFLCGVSAGAYSFFPETSIYGIPLYVGYSFFLFCNVFRIGNRLEPYWYVPFACVAIYGIATLDLRLFWWIVLAVLEPWKWVLIGYAFKRGRYRGIFYERASLGQKSVTENLLDRE